MSTLEELQAYQTALKHSEKYLQPGVGFSTHKPSTQKTTEEIILKQCNTIIALLMLITRNIDRLEERIETIETFVSEFNKNKTKEIDDLMEKIKTLNLKKQRPKQQSKTFWRLEKIE